MPSGPALGSRLTCPYQSVGFRWNVVIRCSDEMPGNGRLAGRVEQGQESSELDGWTGLAPRLFANDPLDPVTPDSIKRAPVFAPFRPTMESCISVIKLWVVL